jgi:hypothetical protein
MTGPEHYEKAQNCLCAAAEIEDLSPQGHENAMELLTEAQVHATLALAAATAYPAMRDYVDDDGAESRAWAQATS